MARRVVQWVEKVFRETDFVLGWRRKKPFQSSRHLFKGHCGS